MFKVFINDGTNEVPKDDIYYIVSKEGTFLHKKVGIMESVAPVENISILESMDVQLYAKLHIPKIPPNLFAQCASFLKHNSLILHSESICLIFYNQEKKKFKLLPPYQLVSAGGIRYIPEILDGYDLIGDVHSHPGSAFHSSTDQSDEETFDGLHITLGYLNQDDIQISCSIMSNGMRVMVDPEEYISGLICNKPPENLPSQFTNNAYNLNRYYIMCLDEYSSYDTQWDNKIDTMTTFYACNRNPDLDRSEAILYFMEIDKDLIKEVKTPLNRFMNGGYGTANLYDLYEGLRPNPYTTFPLPKNLSLNNYKPDDDDDFIPCLDCIFRDHKVEVLFDMMDENGDFEVDEVDEENNYIPEPDKPVPGFFEKSLEYIKSKCKRL
jgi:hypothetical protein